MTPIDRTQIGPLHQRYCTLTGFEIQNTLGRIWSWEKWLLKGWVMDDLVTVLSHLLGQVRRKERTLACLRFSTLIQDTENFEEHLSMALALSRRPAVDRGRSEALKATGRSAEPCVNEAYQVGDVIRASKGLQDLLKLRDNL